MVFCQYALTFTLALTLTLSMTTSGKTVALSLMTRATSPNSLAHACKHVYTRRITVCECMHARWQVLPICSYPRVNPCGYEYGSPVVYPLENPYLHGGYGFFGGLGMGMALDIRGLPVLLPTCPHRYLVGLVVRPPHCCHCRPHRPSPTVIIVVTVRWGFVVCSPRHHHQLSPTLSSLSSAVPHIVVIVIHGPFDLWRPCCCCCLVGALSSIPHIIVTSRPPQHCWCCCPQAI